MDPCLFLPDHHLSCLTHHKTCWTMPMNNVDLKTYLLEDLELHGHYDIFSEVVPGRVLTANHKFYRGLGWLHGPGCKRPFRANFTHEPRAATIRLWEPKRKWSKTIPTHLQNHVVWSRTLKCSVKSYLTGPSTRCYFNEFLFMRVLTHD